MTVTINGVPHELPGDATLADVVAMVTGGVDGRGVAVARNGDVILRSAWKDTQVTSDDRVEVLHAVQGG
jgi:sulfur carrier protein